MITELDSTAKMVLSDTKIIEETKNINIGYKIIKRSLDIIISLIGCVFLLPIILIIKIITLLSGDFHSIFYNQIRIGKDGKEFKLYKFRSMIPDADIELKRLLKEDKKLATEYKKMKKLDNDPRITKIGKTIRKTSIDELPQFINILKGDMTLIGNRPYLPREKKDMKKYFDDIVKTKPGLTGFWQVSLRSRGTFEQRMKMEKYYSNNCSLKFDFQIFLKTFSVVIGGKDAK